MSEGTQQVPDQGILDRTGYLRPTERRTDSTSCWVRYGVREEPSPGYTGLYEGPGDYTGVCCSGGGIRSAAFNLGALQVVLANKEDREKIKYISAVSGGSYIASAYCMVAKQWPRGKPNGDDSDPDLVDDDTLPFHPGSPEEQYLRNHLGYLAPDGSAKLYLALRMLAGLLTNVMLIGVPVLVAGILLGFLVDWLYIKDDFDMPYGAVLAVVVVALGSLALSLLDVIWRPRDQNLQRAARTWQVRLFLLACGLFVLLIAVPWLAGGAPDSRVLGSDWVNSIGAALSSVGALAAAAVVQVRGRVKDKQREIAAVKTRLGKYLPVVRNALIAIVVMLAGPTLLLAVAVLGVLISVNGGAAGLIVLAAAVGVFAALWLLVDLTTVSLHPFYRRQLATAFALRRVWQDETGEVRPVPRDAKERAKGRIVAKQRPFETIVKLSESRVLDSESPTKWPMLIVCAAANVSDPGATPPGRSVASFTFSPTAIGGPLTGATKTTVYESLTHNRQRDLTLPAAVAMSGAALSPTMGKMTYRPLTFLLGLANIRLGVWVPNPRHVNEACARPEEKGGVAGPGMSDADTRVWHRAHPGYLWKELFGRNRLDDKFLYVTDGGHYENLGLVELLRRGCRTIYCFDAGGGVTNQALRDAIALARTELNVTIDMKPEMKLLEESKNPPPRSKAVCAEGTIRYPGEETAGRLFYARSLVAEDSPWDVTDYQEDGVFPHHSTFDQFFTDQHFEAYRRLGSCAAERAVALEKGGAVNGAARVEGPQTEGETGKIVLELEPEEV